MLSSCETLGARLKRFNRAKFVSMEALTSRVTQNGAKTLSGGGPCCAAAVTTVLTCTLAARRHLPTPPPPLAPHMSGAQLSLMEVNRASSNGGSPRLTSRRVQTHTNTSANTDGNICTAASLDRDISLKPKITAQILNIKQI